MRFLLSRRWVLFGVAVVALAVLATLLGQWQFHRLDGRRDDNRTVARNLSAAPVPIEEVLGIGRPVPDTEQWRRVTVRGMWDETRSVIVKYRTRGGGPGVDVVTPLVTASGDVVAVDRGWLATANSGSASSRPKLPEVTTEPVTVTGYVRLDATGSATRVSDLATRAVSSRTLTPVFGAPTYGGFLELATQSPTPAETLASVELPDDTSEGPHFFYGLQWWFFAGLAIVGFGYLAWDERQRAMSRRR